MEAAAAEAKQSVIPPAKLQRRAIGEGAPLVFSPAAVFD